MAQLDEVSQSIGHLQGTVDALVRAQEMHVKAVAEMHEDTRKQIADLQTALGTRLSNSETDVEKLKEYVAHQKGYLAALAGMSALIGSWFSKVISGLFG